MTAGRWAFLTFGAGLPNWRGAANRLGAQARASGWFDTTAIVTDRDLRSRFPEFWLRHKRVLNLRTRGYGYWIWKPFLLRETLLTLGETYDGVLYLDAGCELNVGNPRAASRFWDYQGIAKDFGLFAMHLPEHNELSWSRVATMDFLGLGDGQRRSPQNQGGIVMVTRDQLGLLSDWLDACVAEEYAYVKDAPIGEINSPSFQAHRHDQAIFSGLVKKAGVTTIPDETFWAPDWTVTGIDYPIWATRNRTRVSILAPDVKSRATRLLEKSYSRGAVQILGLRR